MEERPKKKRKIFQDVLPAEMIENIILQCSTITLESLAVTCKQIHSLVSKIFEKSIEVKFRLIERNGKYYTKAWGSFSIKGNGEGIKRAINVTNSPGTLLEKFQTIRKKLDDRNKLGRLTKKLLNIMNMTDMAKINQMLAKYNKNKLAKLSWTRAVFDVKVNSQHIRYKYEEKDPQSNNKNKEKENNKKEAKEDPDLDTTKHTDWDTMDELMLDQIKRLKCALCAIKMKKFYKKIGSKLKGNNSVSIQYGNDDIDNKGWELDCSDTGYVTAITSDWHDEQGDFRDTKNVKTRQYRPSTLKPVFANVADYVSEKEAQNHTKEDDENNGVSDFKLERRRKLTIELKDVTCTCEQMSEDDLARLMAILEPVTLPLGLDLDY